MLLCDLSAYLEHKQRVSLAELSVAFGLEADVLSPMVAHFVRKGWVHAYEGKTCQGCSMSCQSCDLPLWYEWQGKCSEAKCA